MCHFFTKLYILTVDGRGSNETEPNIVLFSRFLTKPVFVICGHQRHRSASDQRLCYLLPTGSIIPIVAISEI